MGVNQDRRFGSEQGRHNRITPEFIAASGGEHHDLAADHCNSNLHVQLRQIAKVLCSHTFDDHRSGGFLELLERDWQPKPAGRFGGDRKSLDVHMHMMEALTSFYAMTGLPSHRRRLQEVIDLIISRMLHPQNGLGYMQFTYDFQPLPRIIFATEWGRDAAPADQQAAPIDQTSPGHNVEFAWLLLHAADALGIPRAHYADIVRRQCDHCIEFGIDPQYGGVYADTPMARPTALTEKQFYDTLTVACDATAQALAFNFLCSSQLAAADWLTWHRRDKVLDFARRLCPSVVLDDGYIDGDCTIVMRKHERAL